MISADGFEVFNAFLVRPVLVVAGDQGVFETFIDRKTNLLLKGQCYAVDLIECVREVRHLDVCRFCMTRCKGGSPKPVCNLKAEIPPLGKFGKGDEIRRQKGGQTTG